MYTSNPTLYAEVAEFISFEADLLDHKGYRDWLALWAGDGHYIVPVDLKATEFADKLNFAYDDAEMREMRVRRLLGGESVSSSAMEKTVRNVTRFRILAQEGDLVDVRCAMLLSEVRHEQIITYAADLEYRLQRTDNGFRIVQKVVRLLSAESHLRTVAFIF